MNVVAHVAQGAAIVVGVLAWRVARLRPQHRPMAWWLVVASTADFVRWSLGWWLDVAPVPYSGAVRALYHADTALLMVEPVGLAAVALVVLAGAAPWHLAGAASAVWCVLAVGYGRGLRGRTVMRVVDVAIEAAALAVVAACGALWMRRRRWPTMTEILIAMYAAVRVSLLVAGPYAAEGGPWGQWWRGDGAQVSVIVASLVVHVAWLRSIR